MFSVFNCFITFFCVVFNFVYLIFKNYDIEKISIYECGFDPFEDALGRFDIRFYLVSILFLIFDIEVIFLFPWALVCFIFNWLFWIFSNVYIFNFVNFRVFVLYEWFRGALEWS